MLLTTGGIQATAGLSFNSRVPIAPSSVTMLPNTTSQAAQPVIRLATTQPTVRPGTAAAVNTGRIVSASERRTWIAPLAMPRAAAMIVNTTYRAAITPPNATIFVVFFFIFPSFSFV